MKILHIHKYYNKMRSGGSITALFETQKLLKKKGHTNIIFSMQNEANEKTPYSKYFAKHFDVHKAKNIFQKIFIVPKIIYNKEARKKLEKLIETERPDIAHVHDIYHYLTPSIFFALKKYKIPTVMKLPEYKIICPNYKLFAHGKICTRCKGEKFYNAIIQKCHMNSRSASFIVAIEAYFHKLLKSYNQVDFFLAPSEFMKKTFISFGIKPERIKLLRNTLNFQEYSPNFNKEKYFIYTGRISEEKGLKKLIDAVKILYDKRKLNGFKLKIMGEGPQESTLKKYVKTNNLKKVVEFIGFQKKGTLAWENALKKASFSILPSIWFDNSPVAISESMAFGTPVIVSNRGGTKEMIEDGVSGLVFDINSVDDFVLKIATLIKDADLVVKMGKAAVKRVSVINNEENYYKNLITAYQTAINKNIPK